MIGALLFIFIGLPIICYLLASVFEALGAAFKAFIEFPDKIIKIYKKDGTKGLLRAYSLAVGIFVYLLFMIGGMCIGIAMFAKEKVAPYTYELAYKTDPYGALIMAGVGLVFLVLSVFLGIKLYKAIKTK